MTTELFQQASPHPDGYRNLRPLQIAGRTGSVRLIDVREPHEFDGELGHVPGAELVPLGTLEQAARTWDRAEALVLICRSGARSARAAALLTRMGFTRVMNLDGGMLAYSAAGLPLAHSGAERSERTRTTR